MTVFQVPASKASINQNRFQFNLPGNRKKNLSVPLLKFAAPVVVKKLTGITKLEAVEIIIEHYHPGLFAEFEDQEQVLAWYDQWTEESGITVGESVDSTDS
ncbi:hypothetical protein EDF18_0974 [Frigoribacterium sp. PhB107]|uniref:hypothetical protein n=1 Tax=Frigoribacterium sp. PhB107 TaxID=2485172 RepID=UPI000F48FA21|nr:hypothetical protein [Frigoribacterium sp. PhB107]ROP78328.1 hypothetical protein EDF18_0974 [Frigoribacterium sp. PhB107]